MPEGGGASGQFCSHYIIRLGGGGAETKDKKRPDTRAPTGVEITAFTCSSGGMVLAPHAGRGSEKP
jgi:hypothetical protein